MQPLLKAPTALGTLKAFGEVNDVRPLGSPPLEHYITSSIRLYPKSAARPKPVYLQPENYGRVWGPQGPKLADESQRSTAFFPKPGYASTHLVPGNRSTAVYDAAVVTRGWTLRWSYFHFHPQWQQEYRVYMNATPAQLGLDKLGTPWCANREPDGVETFMQRLSSAPMKPFCTYSRDDQLSDQISGTVEHGDTFYRLFAGACANLHVKKGTPMSLRQSSRQLHLQWLYRSPWCTLEHVCSSITIAARDRRRRMCQRGILIRTGTRMDTAMLTVQEVVPRSHGCLARHMRRRLGQPAIHWKRCTDRKALQPLPPRPPLPPLPPLPQHRRWQLRPKASRRHEGATPLLTYYNLSSV